MRFKPVKVRVHSIQSCIIILKMAVHGYAEVDHTADIAIRVWGEDFFMLLTQASQGLYALMGIVADTGSSMAFKMSIPLGNRETILVDFLSELLYLVELDNLILDDFVFFLKGRQILRFSQPAIRSDLKNERSKRLPIIF